MRARITRTVGYISRLLSDFVIVGRRFANDIYIFTFFFRRNAGISSRALAFERYRFHCVKNVKTSLGNFVLPKILERYGSLFHFEILVRQGIFVHQNEIGRTVATFETFDRFHSVQARIFIIVKLKVDEISFEQWNNVFKKVHK